jgi:predicted metalloprotease with PDZ domain
VKSYSFDDVVAGLNATQPYDWAAFLKQRVRMIQPRAPMGGIEGGGWKLMFNDKRSELWTATEEHRKLTDLTYSIGMKFKEDGTIVDVEMGGPAQKAGIAPATKLMAVNNRQFTPTILRETLQKKDPAPIELLVKSGEYYELHRVDYHGGERYPHLERVESKPDLISAIVAPMAK